jgi:WD40 repeat protein
LTGHLNAVISLAAINSDLIASSSDKNIIISDLVTEKMHNRLIGHTNLINYILVLSTNHIASSSYDGTVRIWDINMDVPLKTFISNSHTIYSMVLLYDEGIVIPEINGTINLWNISNETIIKTFTNDMTTKDILFALVVLKNGYLACGSKSGAVQILDLNETNGEIVKKTIQVGSDPILSMTLIQNEFLAVGLKNGDIHILDVSEFNKTDDYKAAIFSSKTRPNMIDESRNRTIKMSN